MRTLRASFVYCAVIFFLIGLMTGGVLVEHLAPRHPNLFCRPTGDVCQPYPWSP